MSDSPNHNNPAAHAHLGFRWTWIGLACLCVIGVLYLLFKGGVGLGAQSNTVSDFNAAQISGVDYTGRWVSVDEITRPEAAPFDITELTVTDDHGLLGVEVRGQKVDEVANGTWTQKPCLDGCLLGFATTTYASDPVNITLSTGPGLQHQFALTVKPSAPGSDEMLTVTNTTTLDGKMLATSTQQFVPHSVIHNVLIMDTGLPQVK